MSHPTWVRGLKLQAVSTLLQRLEVAPYVGAWIETVEWWQQDNLAQRRTLRGCVD